MTDENSEAPIEISLGISLEPAAEVEAQLNLLRANTSSSTAVAIGGSAQPAPMDPNSTAALAGKIMQHAFNFLSGFATNDGMISLKAFGNWWTKFQARLSADPQFLERLGD